MAVLDENARNLAANPSFRDRLNRMFDPAAKVSESVDSNPSSAMGSHGPTPTELPMLNSHAPAFCPSSRVAVGEESIAPATTVAGMPM